MTPVALTWRWTVTGAVEGCGGGPAGRETERNTVRYGFA